MFPMIGKGNGPGGLGDVSEGSHWRKCTCHFPPQQQYSGIVHHQHAQPRCQQDQDYLTDRQPANELLQLPKQSVRHLSHKRHKNLASLVVPS